MVVVALVVAVVVLWLLALVAVRSWDGNPQAELRQRAPIRAHERYDGGADTWGGGFSGGDGGSACGDGGGGSSC